MLWTTQTVDREPSAGWAHEASQRTVVVVRRFSVPPLRVLQAWTDPRISSKWLFTTKSSRSRCDFVMAAEGSYSIVRRIGQKETLTWVSYRKLDHFKGLVFTYWKGSRPEFGHTLMIGLSANTEGCLLTLTQNCVGPGDDRYLIRRWESKLDALRSILENWI
jgi:uncharacterized protein YndB with AHSA1/START domain